ncbi:MAG: DUF1653 domain-containing protein [Porticoccaceae bacterium]|jgi:hypothetical protein|nr:DUF1653 domain-containing protein [Porticoccaceae bacterium]MBT7375710.1 DUF1653 domain-containing protein [Porticoccaceae bacterium]MDB2533573.1 DUF1653 domain-containing protein [Porticoccaceae bacterium]MDG1485874.1 DUF1653 domain-containing protein [Porticoccaceae bacterium]
MNLENGIYKHHKGNLYEVLGVARHSETEEQHVVYKTLYGDYSMWIRPLAMFVEQVEVNGELVARFEFVEPAPEPRV